MSDGCTPGPCAFTGPQFSQPTWWWLSFADPDRAKGDHFLGVVIVQAPGVDRAGVDLFNMHRLFRGHPAPFSVPREEDVSHTLAVRRCHELGVNPGGQVVGWPFEGDLPPEELRERLLTKDDLIAAGLYVGNIADNGGWENYQ